MVLFMTPGLAFFYGGMDRSRNVLNMLMMNFWCLLIIPIAWVVIGYSIAGGDSSASWFGGFDAAFLGNLNLTSQEGVNINADVGLSFHIEPSLAPHLYLKYRKNDLMDLANGYVRNAVREAFNIAGRDSSQTAWPRPREPECTSTARPCSPACR